MMVRCTSGESNLSLSLLYHMVLGLHHFFITMHIPAEIRSQLEEIERRSTYIWRYL
jgi:succinate dehydrogenase/fumarate reductase cytochrome b subunit